MSEMYFCPLFSGSSGNALFCQYGDTRLLIDAGKPGRQIEEALGSIGVAPETLDGVLITHEHSDHIQGAGVIYRKYGLPLYATSGTWAAMERRSGRSPRSCGRRFRRGGTSIWGISGWRPFPFPTTRRTRWASGSTAAA